MHELGCIAPCEPAQIKLIDFPETLRNQFRDVIVSCYLPGHSFEQTSKMSNCHEVSLNGDPWSSNSRTGITTLPYSTIHSNKMKTDDISQL